MLIGEFDAANSSRVVLRDVGPGGNPRNGADPRLARQSNGTVIGSQDSKLRGVMHYNSVPVAASPTLRKLWRRLL